MVILGLVGELDFFPSADASSFFGGFVAGMKRAERGGSERPFLLHFPGKRRD